MRRQFLFFFLCFFFPGPLSLWAFNLGDEGWEKERVVKGLTVYTRSKTDSRLLEIKAVGTIKASLPAIMANLRDVENSPKWTPDLREKVTLQEISDKEAVTYSLTELPWPLYDRSLILHNQLKLDKKKKLLFVHSYSVPSKKKMPPSMKNSVLAEMNYGIVALRPTGREECYIELMISVDPKGSIPTWIVNFFQKKWPVEFLSAIEKRSREYSPPLKPGLKRMMRALLREMKWPGNYFKARAPRDSAK